jgi:ribosomal protein L11 methyltransferase
VRESFVSSYQQLTITAPARLRIPLINLIMRHGSLGVIEESRSFRAYFPLNSDLNSLTNELNVIAALIQRSSSRQSIFLTRSEIPGQDWNSSWKEQFAPITVGRRFAVLPPWERPPRGRIPLVVDPGMAFGTGHHETTRSCLTLMERYAGTIARRRFLDLGTGTGLLAIAARRLGFTSAIGVDTDPLSIKAARRNRRLNKITGIVLREGGLEAVRGDFDMIAANLISGTLITLAQAIALRTAPSGLVIMSGILNGQDAEVVAAAKKAGFMVPERLRDGKWVSLVCRR